MKSKFKLIMISAMYENGGNTLQRHLDGHPNLYSYPFESQLGTKKTSDYLDSFVPHKYRWPQFQIGESSDEIYEDIWDEEVKIRVKAPHMSKFKNINIELSDKQRKQIFMQILNSKKITRSEIVEAFFIATNLSWKNYKKSGKEKFYVGYNPVQILDAEKIIEDFSDVKIIHIVRNPFSAYAETKHRPAPLSLQRYINTWNMVQLTAINLQAVYPQNIFIVKFEDLIKNKKEFFTNLCKDLKIEFKEELLYPSWNGEKLENVYPWGTIEYSTQDYNLARMKELSANEYKKIKLLTKFINEYFGYQKY